MDAIARGLALPPDDHDALRAAAGLPPCDVGAGLTDATVLLLARQLAREGEHATLRAAVALLVAGERTEGA